MKNYLLILIFILVSHCGFTAVYKNQENVDFKISIMEMGGDKSVNNLVKSKLNRFIKKETDNIYKIKINSNFSKTVLSRDATGKASSLKLSTSIEFVVSHNDKTQNISFEENLNIESLSDSYEQNKYENIVKDNLVTTIVEELILKLNLFKWF